SETGSVVKFEILVDRFLYDYHSQSDCLYDKHVGGTISNLHSSHRYFLIAWLALK
ncbi:hypothetical protein AAULR_03946, partial [Lacticaseibacillus rhamnosus MTCC 5462]